MTGETKQIGDAINEDDSIQNNTRGGGKLGHLTWRARVCREHARRGELTLLSKNPPKTKEKKKRTRRFYQSEKGNKTGNGGGKWAKQKKKNFLKKEGGPRR